MMIFSLVAMIGLEKCCITSACLQWLCHSGERTVAHGPLVFLLIFFIKACVVGTHLNCIDKSVFFFLLIFFIKAYVVGTHLNCIDKWMQFRWVPTTDAFIKK